jgi:hypothetical protein
LTHRIESLAPPGRPDVRIWTTTTLPLGTMPQTPCTCPAMIGGLAPPPRAPAAGARSPTTAHVARMSVRAFMAVSFFFSTARCDRCGKETAGR